MSAEKEEFVADDRTTQNAAELIALQSVALGCECVASIENLVADELEKVSVVFVGAGFRNGIDRASRVPAILGRHRARFDLELLQCVRKR